MAVDSVPLADLCDVDMGQAPVGTSYNDIGEGLPLIAGAADFGDLHPSPKKFTTAPGKICTTGDIILCIRATIGDLNLADRDYCLGRGVAGLRPKPGKLDSRFLWQAVTKLKPALAAKGTGSTFKQVRRADIESLEIPNIELDEQKRIAAILDKADAIRRKRQQAIHLADDFLRSVFLEMFGDPATNPYGWPTAEFGAAEVGLLERGKSRHRPRNDPVLLGGPYPLIQTGDIANSGGYIRTWTQTYSELGLQQSRLWPAGTLCITIAANIAKTGILRFDACFPDSVVGFTPAGHLTAEYVQHWMGFLQKMLEASAPESAQKNINLEILRSLDLMLPPPELVAQFTAVAQRTEEAALALVELSQNADVLSQSIANMFFDESSTGGGHV